MQHAACSKQHRVVEAPPMACHNHTTEQMYLGMRGVSESQCACVYFKAFPKTAWHAKWQTAFISPPSTLGWLIEFLHIALANSTIGWKATQSPFPRKKKDKKAEQEIECATKLCRSKLRCMHPHAPCQLLKSSLSLKSKFIACKKS